MGNFRTFAIKNITTGLFCSLICGALGTTPVSAQYRDQDTPTNYFQEQALRGGAGDDAAAQYPASREARSARGPAGRRPMDRASDAAPYREYDRRSERDRRSEYEQHSASASPIRRLPRETDRVRSVMQSYEWLEDAGISGARSTATSERAYYPEDRRPASQAQYQRQYEPDSFSRPRRGASADYRNKRTDRSYVQASREPVRSNRYRPDPNRVAKRNTRPSRGSRNSAGYARIRQDDPFGENQNDEVFDTSQDRGQDPFAENEGFDPFAEPPGADRPTDTSPRQPQGRDPFPNPPGTDRPTDVSPRQPQGRDPFGNDSIEPRQPEPRQPEPRQPEIVPNPPSRTDRDVPQRGPTQSGPTQSGPTLATPDTRPRNAEYPPGAVEPGQGEPDRRQPDPREPNNIPFVEQPNRHSQTEPPMGDPSYPEQPFDGNYGDSNPAAEPYVQSYPSQNGGNQGVAPPATLDYPSHVQAQPRQPSYPPILTPQSMAPMAPMAQPQYPTYPAYPTYSAQPQYASDLSLGTEGVYQGVAGCDSLGVTPGCNDCGFACGAPMYYFSVFGGKVELQDLVSTNNNKIFTKDGPGFGVALGQRHGTNLRSELEFSYRTNDVTGLETNSVYQDLTGDLTSYSGMANVYWEFAKFPRTCFKPYIGAGIGFTSIESDFYSASGRSVIPQADNNDTSLAYQAIVGVNYKAYRNMDLFVEYRFFAADTLRIDALPGFGSGKYDYESDNLFAGLRWKF